MGNSLNGNTLIVESLGDRLFAVKSFSRVLSGVRSMILAHVFLEDVGITKRPPDTCVNDKFSRAATNCRGRTDRAPWFTGQVARLRRAIFPGHRVR
jgi:hypothetical protein